jgi:hypothetical protein
LIAAQMASVSTENDFVEVFLAQAEGFSPTYLTAVPSENRPTCSRRTLAGRQRLLHRVAVKSFDADDLDFRQTLDVGGHASRSPPPPMAQKRR